MKINKLKSAFAWVILYLFSIISTHLYAQPCVYGNTGYYCISEGSVGLNGPTNTAYVCLGDSVTVTAAPNIANDTNETVTYYNNTNNDNTPGCPPDVVVGTSPPAYDVTWTASVGNFTLTRSGLTATFTPTDAGDGKVIFTCNYTNQYPCTNWGSSFANAAFTVCQITNECMAIVPDPQSRTIIGVGEQVNLWLVNSPSGEYSWSASAGSLNPTTGNSTMFTAPSNSATVIITLSYQGGECQKQFNVVEPTSINNAVIESTVDFQTGEPGSEMHLSPVIMGPADVSFYRVQCMEIGDNAIDASGYFIINPPPSHIGNGADVWFQLGQDNSWPNTWDWAGFWGFAPPWSDGGFSWPIPAVWKIDDGPTNSLTGWSQSCSIDDNGTVTVSKFNHSATRTTNNVYSTQ